MTWLTDEQDIALEMAVKAAQTAAPHLPRWVWRDVMEKYSFRLIRHTDGPIGFISIRKNDIHCYIMPEYRGRWIPRYDLRDLFAELLYKYGEVTTAVEKTNHTGIVWVQRLGFKQDGESDRMYTFKLKEYNYV